jgi:hypothetical protein
MQPITACLVAKRELLSLFHITRRAHALMRDVVQPMLTDQGFTYIQYFGSIVFDDGPHREIVLLTAAPPY